MNVHRTFISYADTVEADRAALADIPGGEGMLTTGLSYDGLPPAVAYISAGIVDEQLAIQSRKIGGLIVSHEDASAVMDELGLQLINESVTLKKTKEQRHVRIRR